MRLGISPPSGLLLYGPSGKLLHYYMEVHYSHAIMAVWLIRMRENDDGASIGFRIYDECDIYQWVRSTKGVSTDTITTFSFLTNLGLVSSQST
jgi:hypothetical protein